MNRSKGPGEMVTEVARSWGWPFKELHSANTLLTTDHELLCDFECSLKQNYTFLSSLTPVDLEEWNFAHEGTHRWQLFVWSKMRCLSWLWSSVFHLARDSIKNGKHSYAFFLMFGFEWGSKYEGSIHRNSPWKKKQTFCLLSWVTFCFPYRNASQKVTEQ